MKTKILILVIIFLLGCEDVIQIDVGSSEPQIVIEAKISNCSNESFVKITETTDYYDSSTFQEISNAKVTIENSKGKTFLLRERESGKYYNRSLKVLPKRNYSIIVEYEEQIYSAESFAPPIIAIDSLKCLFRKRPFQKEKKLEFHIFFQDDVEHSDFARFKIYKNNKQLKKIFLYNDRLTDGNYIDYFFFNFGEEKFEVGDTITVEMQAIDEQSYLYFKSLKNAIAQKKRGPFSSAAPANPTTNWNNNALGYFSAFTVNKEFIIIEQSNEKVK